MSYPSIIGDTDRAMSSIRNKLASKVKSGARAAGAGVLNVANAVTEVSGGKKLADYASSKMAKMMVKPEHRKNVADSTSGGDALKSAGQVAMTVAPFGALGVISKVRRMMGGKGPPGGSSTLKRILDKNRVYTPK